MRLQPHVPLTLPFVELQALQHVIAASDGVMISPQLVEQLLPLLQQAMGQHSRFPREAACAVAGAACQAMSMEGASQEHRTRLAALLAQGLTDDWTQVLLCPLS